MMATGAGGRRFTISDGMLAVAATAAGLACSSQVWPALRRTITNPGRTFLTSWEWAYAAAMLAVPCLLAWTMTPSSTRNFWIWAMSPDSRAFSSASASSVRSSNV